MYLQIQIHNVLYEYTTAKSFLTTQSTGFMAYHFSWVV